MAILNIDIQVKDDGSVQINKVTKSAKNAEKETSKLKQTNKALSNSYKDLKTDIGKFVGVVASIYAVAKAFQALYDITSKIVADGFAWNKQIEESKAGLNALALVMQDKALPLTERMIGANKEAIVTLKELQKINALTPHTLDQTNKIYKAMYVSMKNVGASSQEIINLTQKLSVAAGAAGIEFNSLLAGVDGLATGTVLANSDLGRFLGSLGLTNQALKESDDVVKLLNESMKDFRQLDTITTATSNLANAWGELAGELTQDIFKGSKDGLNDISTLLKSMNDEDIKNIRESFNGMAIAMLSALTSMAQGVVFLADGFESLGARIAEAAFRIENGLFLNDAETAALERMIQKTKDNIAGRAAFIATLKKSEQALITSIIVSQNASKANISQADTQEILNARIEKEVELIGQATEVELEKIYADELAAIGLDKFGNELAKVNTALGESVGYYDDASQSIDDYSNAVDRANNSVLGASSSIITSSTYRASPQDYYDMGWELPADYYTNPEYRGYATGGYTGDMSTSEIAGVVHGQEYIVDAQTTSDLGLNGSGGIFESMDGKLDQLANLYEINKTLKRILTIDKNTYTLLEERLAV